VSDHSLIYRVEFAIFEDKIMGNGVFKMKEIQFSLNFVRMAFSSDQTDIGRYRIIRDSNLIIK
jgi:hypothetical protein